MSDERSDGLPEAMRDAMGEIDGEPVALRDVPKGRRAEWRTRVDGRWVRPFRFIGTDDDNPFG